MFMNKKRQEIKEKLEKDGLTGKDLNTSISKVAASQWREASEEEKKEYNDLYLKDKIRYEEEMKNYKPPPPQ